MTDPFASSVGSYLLGALDGPERDDFEAHLLTCPACRAAVDELAGLPRALAQVPPELVPALPDDPSAGAGDDWRPAAGRAAGPTDPGDVPPLLLAGLLRAARVDERRRRTRRVAVAALATAAAVALLLVVPGSPLRGPSGADGPVATAAGTPPPAGETVALAPVAPTGPSSTVSSSLELTSVPWGTRLQLAGRYDGTGADGATSEYRLVLRTADGGTHQVATWSAVPGKDIGVPAATSLRRAAIVAVEVTDDAGTVLLTATL